MVDRKREWNGSMRVLTWEAIFGPMTGIRNKRRSLEKAIWNTLTEDVWFDGYEYAKGSKYKFWEGKDFGWVIFDKDSKTPHGNIPGKFIHKM